MSMMLRRLHPTFSVAGQFFMNGMDRKVVRLMLPRHPSNRSCTQESSSVAILSVTLLKKYIHINIGSQIVVCSTMAWPISSAAFHPLRYTQPPRDRSIHRFAVFESSFRNCNCASGSEDKQSTAIGNQVFRLFFHFFIHSLRAPGHVGMDSQWHGIKQVGSQQSWVFSYSHCQSVHFRPRSFSDAATAWG